MTDRQELHTALDTLLQPEAFRDHCPNGLQVEGGMAVRKVVSGVTASLALIDAAIAQGADTILVHHGLFWRVYDGRVTGWMRQRLGLQSSGRFGPLKRIAWCTGGAQGYFEAAIAAGADAFLTGEISEPQAHLAR